ncbi:MAG: FAD-dependent oxidoreductase [Comamonadaceae bacterium]|nr:FAD-dependent oxidoreductase [Comamonadaceae bacterium]
MNTSPIPVIGGGLAGCEAAWQLARRGLTVDLLRDAPACA